MGERRGLGRGLAALIPGGESAPGAVREVPVDAVTANPRQPRGVFDDQDLAELAASIREVGLLQPILVREAGHERYELIAGERRLRAARLAGLARVPAILRNTPDTDLLKEALIENVHRVDLNPLEEAAAYQQLLDDFGVTQEELARRLGKSRPTLTNTLRLLGLPPAVQRKVAAGVLSAGHAKALLALERDEQEKLAERVIAEGLSVRSTEEIVRLQTGDRQPSSVSRRSTGNPRNVRHATLVDLEERLSEALSARVQVTMGARKGKIAIELASVEDLERVVGVIAQGLHVSIDVGERPLTASS